MLDHFLSVLNLMRSVVLEFYVVFVVIVLLCLGGKGVGWGEGRDGGYFSIKTVGILGSCFA